VPQDLDATRQAIADGSAPDELVPDAGPVADLKDQVQEAATEAGEEISVGQPIPGNYDENNFDEFDWT
jgi:hypothetical protein